ncbi:MAG: right-handed parallel beta-helix repeat-containing protein [Polyangia bacterium]
MKSSRSVTLLIASLGVATSCTSSPGGPTSAGGGLSGAAGGSAMTTGTGGRSSVSGGASSSITSGGAGGAVGAGGGAGRSTAMAMGGGSTALGGASASAGGSSQLGGMPASGGVGAGGSKTAAGGAGGASAIDGGVVAGAIYVAPDGDDSAPGTLAQPLKTVAKARDLVETMNSAMTGDITVYLRAGTYPQTSTLTFANADSGSGGFYVKYMAYPGERPLITGGQAIKGWTAYDATNNIYSASAGTTAFRQLYVNGVKAIRARTPNLGASNAPNFNRLTGYDSTNHNVQVAASQVASWKNLTKVEMHVMLAWADNTLRIASITTTGSTAYISFQSPESPMVFVRPNPNFAQVGWGSGRAYYFENAYEFLDQPGEWYLDETTNTVYYKPRSGEDMTSATVIAPMVETIMAVQGTSTSDQAGYLWFEGLTFAHSTFMLPSQQGYLDGQAGQYNLTAEANNDQTVGRPPAGVSVTNANHLHFEANLFTQMGATGLDFISGTHDDMIIGNAFTDIAGNGISIGKFAASDTTEYHIAYNPTDTNEICTNDTIKDNYIYNVTTEFQGACGIAGGYPRQVDIEHNEIAQANYTGISVGYGWTTCTNAMSNNIISYNNIHDIAKVLADGASIYTLSNQLPASQMEYNYVHDYGTSQWADYGDNGLYLDEGTRGYTVAHNVMVNAPTNIVQNGNDKLDPCQLSGSNATSDNSGTSQTTIAAAGIESAYASVKNLTVPAATF